MFCVQKTTSKNYSRSWTMNQSQLVSWVQVLGFASIIQEVSGRTCDISDPTFPHRKRFAGFRYQARRSWNGIERSVHLGAKWHKTPPRGRAQTQNLIATPTHMMGLYLKINFLHLRSARLHRPIHIRMRRIQKKAQFYLNLRYVLLIFFFVILHLRTHHWLYFPFHCRRITWSVL